MESDALLRRVEYTAIGLCGTMTIVALGLDLRGLSTAADLRSAVERIMAERRNNVKAASHRNL